MDMMANYEGLATELLQVNEDLLRVPARHLISKLTQGEHFVLNYLLTHRHQAHPVDLSRGLVVSTARIAALLNRMEDKGLISRLPDPLNNRQVIVTLSPQGLEAIQTFRSQDSLRRPDAGGPGPGGCPGIHPHPEKASGQPAAHRLT